MIESTSPWKTPRRWAVVALALLAAAALLYAVYRPRPLIVEVASATVGRFEQVIEEDGQLRLKNRSVTSNYYWLGLELWIPHCSSSR